MGDYRRISIIADAATIQGFQIAGVCNDPAHPSIYEVEKTTAAEEIARLFEQQMLRKDIAILMICDFASEKIRTTISRHQETLPSVLIIPSKHKCM